MSEYTEESVRAEVRAVVALRRYLNQNQSLHISHFSRGNKDPHDLKERVGHGCGDAIIGSTGGIQRCQLVSCKLDLHVSLRYLQPC